MIYLALSYVLGTHHCPASLEVIDHSEIKSMLNTAYVSSNLAWVESHERLEQFNKQIAAKECCRMKLRKKDLRRLRVSQFVEVAAHIGSSKAH